MAVFPREAPVIQVKVAPEGGQAERVDLSHTIKGFVFEDDEKKADKLTLQINNYDLANFDNPIWREGNTIEATWGYEGRLAPARELVIKSVKGSLVLTVEALAKSVLMNQEMRSRVFEESKRSEIAAIIADENGYAANSQRQHIEDTEVVFECITQARMTDAQFLRHLANKEGFEFFVDFDGFHFHRRRFDQRPLRKFVYFLDTQQGDIISFNVENDVTAKPQSPSGSVTAKGRDPKERKDIVVVADNQSTKDRTNLGDVQKVVDPATGATSLQRNNAVARVQTTTATTEAAAKREAKGAFIKSQQGAVQLTVVAVGDPDIVAKSVVEIEFPGCQRLSGRYYLTSVKHNVPGTYTMEMKCRRDGTSGTGGGGASSSGGASAEEPKNAGKPNTKDPVQKDQLTEKKVVDPVTGQTKTIYVDASGREVK